MIGGDVEQDGDIERQPRYPFELIGGQFEHVGPGRPQFIQVENRITDIAADRHFIAGGGPETCPISAVVGRLTIVPVTPI